MGTCDGAAGSETLKDSPHSSRGGREAGVQGWGLQRVGPDFSGALGGRACA